jgi:integrase
MRGTAKNQVASLVKVSQIYEYGESKFKAQTQARFLGARGSHEIGQNTALYGEKSFKTYKSAWNMFAEFSFGELGVKNLENTTPEQIRMYLEQRIDMGIERKTWRKEASAMNKLAVALSRLSQNLDRGTNYDFSSAIDGLRSVAKAELHENKESRAYHCPAEIIMQLHTEKHQIAASLQHAGGARISEIEKLKPQQFLGLGIDRITGEKVGRIYLDNCKGGQDRIMTIAPETYKRAHEIARGEGDFRIDQNKYRDELKEACARSGENYNGSHGLRWNYARGRVAECQEHGLSYDQALSETSEDMGHHRPEITEHYLQ